MAGALEFVLTAISFKYLFASGSHSLGRPEQGGRTKHRAAAEGFDKGLICP
jgi:hypothetical protein